MYGSSAAFRLCPSYCSLLSSRSTVQTRTVRTLCHLVRKGRSLKIQTKPENTSKEKTPSPHRDIRHSALRASPHPLEIQILLKGASLNPEGHWSCSQILKTTQGIYYQRLVLKARQLSSLTCSRTWQFYPCGTGFIGMKNARVRSWRLV